MKDYIRKILLEAGASAVGFAKAGEIDPEVHKKYEKWIGEGNHGDMSYLERHTPLRQHPENVLKGAKTVISIAFSYSPEVWRPEDNPSVATYAYGEDYHLVLREILQPIVKNFQADYGGRWRICIDSAPIAERYWAMKSGIGKIGVNGSVIVKGCGSLCFLTEILTTLEIMPDEESKEKCNDCRLCVTQCPANAIKGDGSIDARKCINYLTIEKKGEFTKEEKKIITSGKGFIFGCDKCLRICPHNSNSQPTIFSQFSPTKGIESLTPEKILAMEENDFQILYNRSPLLYAGFEKLRRNAKTIINKTIGND